MATDKLSWDEPHDVDDLTAAFPSSVKGTLLPPMEVIPVEFKNHHNQWCHIVSKLFFLGGILPRPKKGVDAAKAKRHLMAVLGSFEPSHEHKTAGAAWLMSMWYEEPKA